MTGAILGFKLEDTSERSIIERAGNIIDILKNVYRYPYIHVVNLDIYNGDITKKYYFDIVNKKWNEVNENDIKINR